MPGVGGRADHLSVATRDHPECTASMIDNALARLRSVFHRPLVNSRIASAAIGVVELARARFAKGHPKKLAHFLRAARRMETASSRESLTQKLQPYVRGPLASTAREHQINWSRYITSFGRIYEKSAIANSLLLKAPGPNGEKGVLYSSFEYNWLKLLVHHDARSFLSDYVLVGASSGSPTDFAPILSFAGLSDDPLFIGISNVSDIPLYSMFRPVMEPLNLMACDWNDPAMFAPRPAAERDVEIVMLANWLKLKRHWLLFEALRRLPRNWRVVLIGRDSAGRTEASIRAEAKAWGVRQDLELITNIPVDQVSNWLCRGRVSPSLSDREGSCVAVTESMMADTPVIMMRDAHVGAKAHVNERTGAITGRRDLWRVLGDTVTGNHSYTPRAWALKNISAAVSSARLNGILRSLAERTGRPWTSDIAPLCWRYVPSYLDYNDISRMAPAVEALTERHGVELVKFKYS